MRLVRSKGNWMAMTLDGFIVMEGCYIDCVKAIKEWN